MSRQLLESSTNGEGEKVRQAIAQLAEGSWLNKPSVLCTLSVEYVHFLLTATLCVLSREQWLATKPALIQHFLRYLAHCCKHNPGAQLIYGRVAPGPLSSGGGVEHGNLGAVATAHLEILQRLPQLNPDEMEYVLQQLHDDEVLGGLQGTTVSRARREIVTVTSTPSNVEEYALPHMQFLCILDRVHDALCFPTVPTINAVMDTRAAELQVRMGDVLNNTKQEILKFKCLTDCLTCLGIRDAGDVLRASLEGMQ